MSEKLTVLNMYDSERASELSASRTPCHSLLVAVVERALNDLLAEESAIFNSAFIWLTSKSMTPYSFRWCLEFLPELQFKEQLIIKAAYTIRQKRISSYEEKN